MGQPLSGDDPARRRSHRAADPLPAPRRGRLVGRHVAVVGVTGLLLAAATGVAAASPGSALYPIRQASVGAKSVASPDEVAAASTDLQHIEIGIAAAQRVGHIERTSWAFFEARLASVHDVVLSAPDDVGLSLRARWTRDAAALMVLTVPGTDPGQGPDSNSGTSPSGAPSMPPSTDPTTEPTEAPTPAPSAQPTDSPTTSSGPRPEPSTSQRPTPVVPPTRHPEPTPSGSPDDSTEKPKPTTTPTPSGSSPDPTHSATPTPTPSHTHHGPGEHDHQP